MNTANDSPDLTTARADDPQSATPAQPGSKPESILVSGFLPPPAILAQLSKIRNTQPVAALAAANQHQEALTEPFLQAVERGVNDPGEDFATHGMLFNYASYFLAKWRERRAYPLFIRWFSLAGEDALELGGDTVTHDGARLLASVCGGDLEPLKALIVNREANEFCRGQALIALAVLVGWNELSREAVEPHILFLAHEGLERERSQVWKDLVAVCTHLELLSIFPELRRAHQEGLIDPSFVDLEDFEEAERAPGGSFLNLVAKRYPPVSDVLEATRWWAGFQQHAQGPQPGATQPYLAPQKVGRNDPCPCGSGKKFKKCCGD